MSQGEQVSEDGVCQVMEYKEEIENEEVEEHTTSDLAEAQSAAELNFVVVLLSLLSSENSEEESSSSLAKIEEERHKAKASIKKLQKNKREIDAKPVRRQTMNESIKTTVRDSRHGRRL